MNREQPHTEQRVEEFVADFDNEWHQLNREGKTFPGSRKLYFKEWLADKLTTLITSTENDLLDEMILAARCQCESHESKEEAEMCAARTAEFRSILTNRKRDNLTSLNEQ